MKDSSIYLIDEDILHCAIHIMTCFSLTLHTLEQIFEYMCIPYYHTYSLHMVCGLADDKLRSEFYNQK